VWHPQQQVDLRGVEQVMLQLALLLLGLLGLDWWGLFLQVLDLSLRGRLLEVLWAGPQQVVLGLQ
jgi:hypothetical protein